MTPPLSTPSRLPLRRPLLYLITDQQALRLRPASRKRPDNWPGDWTPQLEAIAAAAAAGCPLIQIREPDLPARSLAAFTRSAIALARPHGALILVNDRLDVALSAGADGVHLRVSSIPAREARRIADDCGRRDFLIGASTHSPGEAQEAALAADFIVCGPVYETPSKRDFGPPLGLERFAEIARSIPIPVLALGGVMVDNFPATLAAGASGVAGIGVFADPLTVAARVKEMLAAK